MAVTLWATLYILRWESRCSEIAIWWDNYTNEYDLDNIRPEFKGAWVRSKITGKYEQYYPNNSRLLRYLVTVILSLPMLLISVIAMTCYMNITGVLLSKSSQGSILKINILSNLAEEG